LPLSLSPLCFLTIELGLSELKHNPAPLQA
jgi:hypothetical protein